MFLLIIPKMLYAFFDLFIYMTIKLHFGVKFNTQIIVTL